MQCVRFLRSPVRTADPTSLGLLATSHARPPVASAPGGRRGMRGPARSPQWLLGRHARWVICVGRGGPTHHWLRNDLTQSSCRTGLGRESFFGSPPLGPPDDAICRQCHKMSEHRQGRVWPWDSPAAPTSILVLEGPRTQTRRLHRSAGQIVSLTRISPIQLPGAADASGSGSTP